MKTHGNTLTDSMKKDLKNIKESSFNIIKNVLIGLKENCWEFKDSITVAYENHILCPEIINVKKLTYIPTYEEIVDEFFGATETDPEYIIVEGSDKCGNTIEIDMESLLPGEEIRLINYLPANAEIAKVITAGLDYFDGFHKCDINSREVTVLVNAKEREIFVEDGDEKTLLNGKDVEDIIYKVHRILLENKNSEDDEETIFCKIAVEATLLPF